MMHQFKREKIVISLVNDMHIEGLMLKKRYKHIYIFLHRIKGKTLRNKERICLWKIIR